MSAPKIMVEFVPPENPLDTCNLDFTEYTRTDLITAMIREAVEAEREACIAELDRMYNQALFRSDMDLLSDWKSHSAAAYAVCLAAIRARNGGEA